MKKFSSGTVLLSILAQALTVGSTYAEGGLSTARIQGKSAAIHLADLLSQEKEKKNGNYRYREARAIETLLYRSGEIGAAVEGKVDYDFSFGKHQKIHYSAATQTLSYEAMLISIDVTPTPSGIDYTVHRKGIFGGKTENGTLEVDANDATGLSEVERSLYDRTQKSRGYRENAMTDAYAGMTEAHSDDASMKPTEVRLDIKEKWLEKGKFDESKWIYTPVKLISWPLQKIFYDIPAMATGLVTESATRSPWHNLLGAWDELRGAGKLSKNAVVDMGRGIVRPKHGTFVDGTLELLDASFKLGNSVLGVVKAGVSIAAYPIYRAFGGKKSQRVALRGKRAVIVLVDSGTGTTFGDGVGDTYGETIVRGKLKSISDYYCIRSNTDPNSVEECIKHIPDNIQYLDIVSLQHSGGMDEAEEYMKLAVKTKNVKPELLLSIGCYDDPSLFVDSENTMGQKKTSWAVHYYLANMLEKRLRGMSAQQAATQAFGEGFVNNAVDPVSWGAVLLIGTQMEDKLSDGYMGSQPSLVTPDDLVRTMVDNANEEWGNYQWDQELRTKLREFHERVEKLLSEGSIQLKPKTLTQLHASEAKLEALLKSIEGR